MSYMNYKRCQCEEQEDNVQHVLMGCWFAEEARNLGFGNGVLKIRYARFKNWVRAILIQNDQVIGCCFGLLAWAIWNACNNKYHKGVV